MSVGDAGLLFKITSNSSQAKTDITGLRTTVQKEVAQIKSGGASDFRSFSKSFDDELRKMDGSAKNFGLRTAQSFGISAKGAADLTHSVREVGKAFAVIGVAAIGAGAALYSLAKNATDAGSEIFDASVKFGFSAETLSALKLAADSSGGSLETVSAALGIFNVNVSKAHLEGSKLNELFTRLKISTTDNESALRRSFEILSKETSATDKARLAKQLFGRSYKDLFGIIEATNGNLDEAIEKYRELGSLITSDMARKADELGDQFTEIGQRFRGMATEIGLEMAPMVIGALEEFAEFVQDNKEGIIDGLTAIGRAIDLFIIKPLQGWILLFGKLEEANRKLKQWTAQFASPGEQAVEAAEAAAGTARVIQGTIVTASTAAMRGATTRRSELSGMLDDIDTKDKKEAKPKKTPSQELLEDLKRTLESVGNRYDILTGQTNVQRVATRLLEAEHAGLDTTLRHEILTTAAAIDRKEKLTENAKIQTKAMSDLKTFIERQNEEVRQMIEGDHNAYVETEKLIAALEKQGITVFESAKQIMRYNALILDTKRTLEYISSMDMGDMFPSPGGAGISSITSGAAMGQQISDMMGGAGPPAAAQQSMDAFEEWGRVLQTQFGLAKENARDFANIIGDTFGQVADAVGHAVQSWVLFGSASGSFRKFAAEVIASVAQMASVQAVFELAQGLAMTALAWFTGNPKFAKSAAGHYLAAAVFGGIAGVAAVAGRVVAGDSFTKGGAGDSAVAGRVSGSNATSDNKPKTLDVNRTAGETASSRMERAAAMMEAAASRLHAVSAGDVVRAGAAQAPDAIANAFSQDYRSNGLSRRTVTLDGQVATA